MLNPPNCVIVDDALCANCAVPTRRVHHRAFPEIRVECGSVAEGLAHLIRQLTTARENVQSHWRHELVDRAIAEATELLGTLAENGQDAQASCRCEPHVPGPVESTLPGTNSSS